ncbi:MAG TPA: N-methyl-L-tryptophan oxidase [Burkholderiales bacterium]|nr:N-methyl-L-tryptophan oxidase [Burkholderiales bacterium]
MTYDAIVVGIGGMGSAALYHLARRGLRVLGIERFDVPHELGSSHGESRIIRLAYSEDPRYVPLLRSSYTLWRELEAETGEQLLIITGGVDAGSEDSATVRGSLASCALHDLPHELLDAAELARRFPGYRLPGDRVAVYQPDGGFLNPERCVAAHAAAAQRLRATLRTRERVLRWHAVDAGVEVETEQGRYRAKKLVISAGPWARTLVPTLDKLAVPERQVMLWTKPLKPEYFGCSAFPVFNMEAPEGRFYGYPIYGAIPGFKIGKYHHRRERIGDLERMDRAVGTEDEETLREGIRRYFPDADGPALAMKPCIFTNSPDEHFILDVLPDHPNVAVAAGFSGHGFKFCSVVGEIMADLAVDGATKHDIALFRLARFA